MQVAEMGAYQLDEQHPNIVQIDLSNLAAGLYLIKVYNDLIDYNISRKIIKIMLRNINIDRHMTVFLLLRRSKKM